MTEITKRSGILAGGNWILDEVKVIDKFPEEQALVNILDEYTSNGGSAYNILTDLTQLGANFPLAGIGLVGNDFQGIRIIDHCKEIGIDTQQIAMIPNVATSYTTVVSVKTTGKRTFFHHRGASSKLKPGHFDFKKSNARIFHLGYLLLLDSLDEVREDGRTDASRLLEKAKSEGFKTSIDLVSEDSERFKTVIPNSLPYVDYLFLNEFEASKLSGINLMNQENPKLMHESCQEVFTHLFDLGVNEWIIIHYPAGVFAAHRAGARLFQPSVKLNPEQIVGSNGAGDALAAAILYGLHEEWTMEENLKLGVCAAAASLTHVTCSDGVLDIEACLNLDERFGYRQ
ncbi:ribokinase [Sphingobacterium sp. DK4209]|uniref:Ribokinase n=1 Tax=Sphingobacterium zhuxiongii TaxID=2662364 RepID=A0A5Q0Q6Q2_9SPHI|nr:MULTISPECIES: carbohydrate kinase family protein [unclassified Sphingobacterium]MVZ66200.1 ribokinase [Sphingobacterium sp. DK4209]QGA24924.1 ribokinase [Sphingobacterium sp. dk4302]